MGDGKWMMDDVYPGGYTFKKNIIDYKNKLSNGVNGKMDEENG